MEALDSIDLQTWRDACKANGLPTSGTKLDCYHRLQDGSARRAKARRRTCLRTARSRHHPLLGLWPRSLA
eukprot:3783575-Prymnesium_polylepis.1